ncbi:hypothetical protein ACKX1U_13270, partial [Staphylococcus haemolyticus]
RNFDLCDYNSAIVNSQNALEKLIKFVIKKYYIEDENKNEQEANDKIKTFKNSIYHNLFPKFID